MKGIASPSPIYVFVTVHPTKRNGLKKPHSSRVGVCQHESEIAKMVKDDLREMSNTFGGLIESAGTQGRYYQAFRAAWTEIKI
jgi:hypothetical protein